MFYTYILKSQKDQSYYYGSTAKNVSERLDEHNSGKMKYTKKGIFLTNFIILKLIKTDLKLINERGFLNLLMGING